MARGNRQKKQKQPKQLPILTKLNSQTSGDRQWACTALAQLVLDPSSLEELRKADIVQVLLRMLKDEPPVVLEALGAIRNLLLQPDIVLEFIHLNGLEHIQPVVEKTTNQIMEAQFQPIAQDPDPYLVLVQCLSIIMCCCEQSDKCFEMTLEPGILQFLARLLVSDVPQPCRTLAGHLLSLLTEADVDLSEAQAAFIALLQDEQAMLSNRLLAGSVLYNLRDALGQADILNLLQLVLKVIAKALQTDVTQMASHMERAGQEIDQQNLKIQNSEFVDLNSESKLLKDLEADLMTLGLGLELLANVFSDENDPALVQLSGQLFQDIFPKLIVLGLKEFQLNTQVSVKQLLIGVSQRSLQASANVLLLQLANQWAQIHGQDLWNKIMQFHAHVQNPDLLEASMGPSQEYLDWLLQKIKHDGPHTTQLQAKTVSTIGVFMMQQLQEHFKSKRSELITVFLDCLFDMYGDETQASEQVFQSQGILQQLIEWHPLLERMHQSMDPDLDPELFGQVDNVLENLTQFIEYKQQLL
ncbi:hypothetical protein EDD86DRAFT_249372 [Gorgonomyces haynaldii]|nr:hypothetical protein EDD86DRAFT_249372 [Gorgonomyces haynaldii]